MMRRELPKLAAGLDEPEAAKAVYPFGATTSVPRLLHISWIGDGVGCEEEADWKMPLMGIN